MRIPIVNEQDEIIDYVERYEADPSSIRRIVSLNVFNEEGEILIAKRQSSKIIDPNCWGPSVAGTVDEGYDYDTTVVKEAEEEIGLSDIKPIFFKKYFYETSKAKRFTSTYYIVVRKDTNFKIQEEEVSEIKWISLKDLEDWFSKRPEDFIPSFKNTLNIIKEIHENKS